MSQQINLLLPELRQRFDWLSLPIVVGTALAGLVALAALASGGAMRGKMLEQKENAARLQLADMQQQVQVLAQKLGARQGDATLDKQLAAARQAVLQRKEVIAVVAQGDLPASHAYSGLLAGFSRQAIDGVWLTGFAFVQKDIEIRGRLTAPALLPIYINRLNAEAAFAGRRFGALDMTGVDPADDKREASTAQAKAAALPRYTEFVLHGELEKAK